MTNHTVTPSLTLKGGAQAIEFYKRAFGPRWGLGTHKEDLTLDEVARRQQQFFASMSAKK